jgi:hypothetical protein
MKLFDRMDKTLVRQMLTAMTVGMKGELFASLVLTDLGCEVVNANAGNVNSKHIDLLVTRNGRTVAVQVKSTSVGSKGSFIAVNDALVQDGVVKWYCIPTLDNVAAELQSLRFVHVDELLRVGKRFPSNAKRCEVQHNVVGSLKMYSAQDWIRLVFAESASANADCVDGKGAEDPLNSWNPFNKIWVGPNYSDRRILVLGESWYGSWADNTDYGYVSQYLKGAIVDGMYTRMANACGALSKVDYWNGIAFTNFVQRVGDNRADRPTRQAYLDARPRLRTLVEKLRPRGVWVLGREQAMYSQPVLNDMGVPNEATAHPTSYGLSNAALGDSWHALLAKVEGISVTEQDLRGADDSPC